jgi:DNA internalization-related competence protein ComEC/Rec2
MKGQLTVPEPEEAFDQKVVCELSGTVKMIVQKKSSRAIYVNHVTVNIAGDEYLCENIIVYCINSEKALKPTDASLLRSYLVGNQITVQGTLQKFTEATNPGQFNEKLYYQIENIDYKMLADKIIVTNDHYSGFHIALDRIKNKLLKVYESILSDKEAGTLIAMLLGEKYLLDDDIKQLYQINGISHILAISGLHISLLGMFVFHLLKKLKCPVVVATLFAIFFIYSYGVLTDFSVSTNRAVVMMSIYFFATIIGKTYDMLSALALSAFLILLQNPLQILSAGFLLSFAAVLGIAVIYPCLQKLYPSKNTVLSSLYISFSAQIATTPVILYFYYQFPLYSLVTNLIILPFVTLLTLTSILAGIVGALILPLGVFLIGGCNYILLFYEWVCRLVSKLPNHLITVGKPGLILLCLSLLFVVLFIWLVHRYERKFFIVLPVLSILILLIPHHNKGFSVTMLDVGQGDCIVMESGGGSTYLVDGGSNDIKNVAKYRIIPFLLSQGKDRIDYAIVSHSDSDHISGIMELIMDNPIKINNLVLPLIQEKDSSYIKLEELAAEYKINLRYIQKGDAIGEGDLCITCLHPQADFKPTSLNSYSTVLSVKYQDFDMLLTGDLEKDGEKAVIEQFQNSSGAGNNQNGFDHQQAGTYDYDILKVAHHGSKYSTSAEFLSLIKPELSLISCSKNNRYGHPHKELLDRLDQIGSKKLITYERGAIMLKTNGKNLEVEQYLKE